MDRKHKTIQMLKAQVHQKQQLHRSTLSPLPSFYRTGGNLSNHHLSVQLPTIDAVSKEQCLVIKPKLSNPLYRKNSIYNLLYFKDKLKPNPNQSNIVTIDFDVDDPARYRFSTNRQNRYSILKERKVQRQKRHHPTSRSVFPNNMPLGQKTTRRVEHQVQLTTRKKFIDTTMNSVMYERERFREMIKKQREMRKMSRQKSNGPEYVRSMPIHERISKKKDPKDIQSFEDTLKIKASFRQNIRRYAVENSTDVRPWTNQLKQQAN